MQVELNAGVRAVSGASASLPVAGLLLSSVLTRLSGRLSFLGGHQQQPDSALQVQILPKRAGGFVQHPQQCSDSVALDTSLS